jgi:hypothetical protein
MNVRTRAYCILALFLSSTLGGCYTYAVMPVEQIPVGADVKARISGEEADRLTQELGSEQDRVIAGKLTDKQASDILLSVPKFVQHSSGPNSTVYQRVTIQKSSLFDVEVRRLDKWKTGGLMALAAALVSVIAIKQFGNNGNPGGEGKGGTDK